ncbi:glycosyltransferase family 2 protein [Alkalilacustris brevis]|uniref:glycosyltransferase family 2 protein n=1 Tax=Alkalilacustris brevis TaxID=2026338 RepID=UPI001EE43FBF|nr:glycosyltransferase family 2 protein [Alkalilacustris brevis]
MILPTATLSVPQASTLAGAGRVAGRHATPLLAPPPAPLPVAAERATRKPIGQILLDSGALASGDLLKALALQARQQLRLGDVLLAHDMVSDAELFVALAEQWDAAVIDPGAHPPDARLIDAYGAARCLAQGVLPWRHAGGLTIVATSQPEAFERQRPGLEQVFGPVALALVSEGALHAAILRLRSRALAVRAESRVAEHESCRGNRLAWLRRGVVALGAALALAALAAPVAVLAGLLAWGMFTLVLTCGLKLTAALATLRARRRRSASAWNSPRPAIARLPAVSVLVPLFAERDIAARLIRRLGRLSYPKELLDVLLVVEADDNTTLGALASRRLPRWMRVITVPAGTLRTKPRALNYALDFCRGSIIGVYDAEDAPESDQLHRVVRRFHERGPELACVQGMLDYYNPRTNWLARCFTIEYAAWFRLVLPGLERLGLALPLGGTTLFFRRSTLEELGGWDAHNVTEDADLGIRLARHGYRTELLDTTTAEEANCRLLPWIRQRSRWIKGYAVTYAVHMRAPGKLLRDLGWWRFLGFQVLFLGTLSQFLLLPLLWSFWLLALGPGHPLAWALPAWALVAMGVAFALSEAVNIGVGLAALDQRRHRFLRLWVPGLHFYFPLAALAGYKALWEVLRRPFYWDKTAHGLHDTAEAQHALPRM